MAKPYYQTLKKRKKMALRTLWLQARPLLAPWEMLKLLKSLARLCLDKEARAHSTMSPSTSVLPTNQS